MNIRVLQGFIKVVKRYFNSSLAQMASAVEAKGLKNP